MTDPLDIFDSTSEATSDGIGTSGFGRGGTSGSFDFFPLLGTFTGLRMEIPIVPKTLFADLRRLLLRTADVADGSLALSFRGLPFAHQVPIQSPMPGRSGLPGLFGTMVGTSGSEAGSEGVVAEVRRLAMSGSSSRGDTSLETSAGEVGIGVTVSVAWK